MSRVWYCATCGYEFNARGKCHECGARRVLSPLSELPKGEEDSEVGYRLDGWTDWARVRLIAALIDAEIEHRFEGEDLVVGAEDEERADDVVAAVAQAVAEDEQEADLGEDQFDPELLIDLRRLLEAAKRLASDPTDMEADTQATDAAPGVLTRDSASAIDDDTWAATGRVTRRLTVALNADEPLEGEIAHEAQLLVKLLEPVVGEPGGEATVIDDGTQAGGEPMTVYELDEWQSEDRATLAVRLETAGIAYRWERLDLLVPEEREGDVDAIFDEMGGTGVDGDDEARYRTLEELFAAAGRLAGDPGSEQKMQDAVDATAASSGSTPLGLDDAEWWHIQSRAKVMVEAIDAEAGKDTIRAAAGTLRDLLRRLV